MIHRIDFAVVDFERSRQFYERALAPLGLGMVVDLARVDGRNRSRYDENWYAAYVLDPDGHNIEAVCRHRTT